MAIEIEAVIPDNQIERVLSKFIEITEAEEILLAEEAAEYLSIHVDTLHKKANKGEIPFTSFKGVRPKLFLKSILKKYKQQI